MASKTQVTTKIRAKKLAGKGKKRKAALRTKGSTRSHAELFGDDSN